MNDRGPEWELACAGCGWSELLGAEAASERLRELGMLRRQVRPDAEEVGALLLASGAKMGCPDCGETGLSASVSEANWAADVTCAECGKVIPAERIAALPGTRFCVNCQGDEERGLAAEVEEFCERCGSPMAMRPSRGAGVTRYVMACTGGCRG